MTDTVWAFAYGSNMHLPDLQRWLRQVGLKTDGVASAVPATVEGYRLVWNYFSKARDGAAANIEACAGQPLLGVALELDAVTLAAIDRKEGHPHRYSRGEATVFAKPLAGGAALDVWLYQVQPEHVRAGYVAPRREYIELMIEAAQTHGLGEAYVASLRELELAD